MAECPYCKVATVTIKPQTITPWAVREHTTKTFTHKCPKCNLMFEEEDKAND